MANFNNSQSETIITGSIYNDSINITGDSVSISCGTGNDYISNSGSNVLIQYTSGDGNDTISGFNSSSTLQIGGGTGTYSTQQSGSDIIVTVGEGSITLVGAASLSAVHINDAEINPLLITFTEGNDNYFNALDGATIFALGGNDTVYDAGWGNKNTVVIEGYKWTTNQSGGTLLINVLNDNDSVVGSIEITNYFSESFNIVSSKEAVETLKIIQNNETNKTITGTDDKEYFENYASNVTLNAGGGDDYIYNDHGSSNSINGGAGNDSVVNWFADSVTIDTGDDDDMIETWGNFVSVNAGAGNDTLYNKGNTNSTLFGGEGNDLIFNNPQQLNALIDGGEGNDTLSNSWAANVTIKGGAGDDSISNSGDNVLFTYASGDGNDTISGFNSTSTLQIDGGTGTYSTQVSGSDIIVTVGEGSITLVGAASLSAVHINDAEINPLLITLTEGNDSYSNTLDGATIQALGGDDYIFNAGSSSVSISSGAGDDAVNIAEVVYTDRTIQSSSVTVDAGEGYDYIYNSGGVEISINAGSDNDEIINSGTKTTINAGTGDDLISLRSAASLTVIEYKSGDGNDTIYGLKATDTVSITGGSYTSVTSGEDIVVTVGEGSITLVGAVGLESINIDGEYNPLLITLTENDDSYFNTLDNATILALGGSDSISNSGANVSIDGGADNDTIANLGSNVTINAGDRNDYIYNEGSNVTIDMGAGDDYINNQGDLISINGGAGNDSIADHGTNVTICAGDGSDTISNYAASVSVNAGAGDDYIYNIGSNVSIEAGAGNDLISLSPAVRNILIEYTSGDGNDIVEGFNSTSTLSITGASVHASDSDLIVTVGEGKITLKDAASLASIN